MTPKIGEPKLGQRTPSGVKGFKPARFAHYLTIGELAQEVGRDKRRIQRLEAEGRIPEAIRHQVGQLSIRLYSPAKVEEIRRIFQGLKPGRPKSS